MNQQIKEIGGTRLFNSVVKKLITLKKFTNNLEKQIKEQKAALNIQRIYRGFQGRRMQKEEAERIAAEKAEAERIAAEKVSKTKNEKFKKLIDLILTNDAYWEKFNDILYDDSMANEVDMQTAENDNKITIEDVRKFPENFEYLKEYLKGSYNKPTFEPVIKAIKEVLNKAEIDYSDGS